MRQSLLFEAEFYLLILFSLILPVGIYAYMMWKQAISRKTVLLLGVLLLVLAGIDIFLLQQMKGLAEKSASLVDDLFFVSELSIALYLLPALFAGIGVNMISHLLINHLDEAERRFEHKDRERR